MGGYTEACAREHGRYGAVRALVRILEVDTEPPEHLPGHTIFAQNMRREGHGSQGYVMPEELEPPDWDSLPITAESVRDKVST